MFLKFNNRHLKSRRIQYTSVRSKGSIRKVRFVYSSVEELRESFCRLRIENYSKIRVYISWVTKSITCIDGVKVEVILPDSVCYDFTSTSRSKIINFLTKDIVVNYKPGIFNKTHRYCIRIIYLKRKNPNIKIYFETD